MSDASTASGPVPCPESTTGAEPATTYWRSLGQLENTPEFQAIVAREFPDGAAEAPDDVSRRGFLTAVAATVALAGLTSCRKPKTNILPFNKRPEGFKPGLPQFYATTLTRGGIGIGVLVKSSDGRPTKIEGNPEHPSSKGGSDARLQAELLQIYDPGRSASVVLGDTAKRTLHEQLRPLAASSPAVQQLIGELGLEAGDAHGEAAAEHEHGAGHAGSDPGYEAFITYTWAELAKQLVLKKGAGLHILLPATTSPSLLAMVGKTKDTFPQARIYAWDPLHRDEELAGAQAAFGKPLETRVDFAKADVVVAFDCDFLALDGNNLGNARDWAGKRRAPQPGQALSRLYVFETCYSTTGTVADHRFRMPAQDVAAAALALAAQLGVGQGSELGTALAPYQSAAVWATAIAKELQQARGRCAVVVGPRQPAAVHAIAHAINAALDNVGKTVTCIAPLVPQPQSAVGSIKELAAALEQGQVEVLACVGTNPVYDAPAELQFGRLLHENKARHTIHLGLHRDETAQLCDWHFPMAHELEAWGDARAHDGTVSLQQPLVAPLFAGLSPLEFLAVLAQQPDYEKLAAARDTTYGYDLVREQWRGAVGNPADFESWWQRTLHGGMVQDSQSAPESAAIDANGVAAAVRAWKRTPGFEVLLRPCPKMWDGRYANNSWMQELPDPLTKLTWDNAALLGPRTAARLGVQNGDLLSIAANGQRLVIPAWILPGHAEEAATIQLGWGRRLPPECKVARGTDREADKTATGYDGYALRTTGAQWLAAGATVSKAGGRHLLVCTQEHGTMAGRALVREATAATYAADHRWAPAMSPLEQAARLEGKTEADLDKSLWVERFDPERASPDVDKNFQWGMVIDLNACTGCSACMIACVAENNVPMVGKTQVARNREMFWIRADRYFASRSDDKLATAEDPQVANMPVPCMQCENAPCESVCPVAATTHSPDGLNDMVYNRCIGTRYCSNNCPYKVRRFNYLDYLGQVPDTRQMSYNPDVTVRSRGVMEKCTYCVQRINGSRIRAKLAGKKVGEGEADVPVTTACAQACPTSAITFGNIADPGSRVAQLRRSDLNYGLLSDLHTRPRTTYLGRVRNPDPNITQGQG